MSQLEWGESLTHDADYIRVKRMTEGEARSLLSNSLVWVGKEYLIMNATLVADAVALFRKLGIIRPETDHERFERETGFKVTDENRAMIEAAWAWRK